jgi:uridylate kinase
MEDGYRYHRILLKLSGEALKGPREHGYDAAAVAGVVAQVGAVLDQGVEMAIVVGAGNVWRGVMGTAGWGLDRVAADQMGMMATVMNALCLKESFAAAGFSAEVQSAFAVGAMVPAYNRAAALKAMEEGRIVIFAGGTGSPFFTTDTTAALRALEMGCDAILKATKVPGVYDRDPKKHPGAKRYETLSFDDALARKLEVMDQAAFSMCRDNGMPVVVFDFFAEDSLDRALLGDLTISTVVS